MMRAISDVVGMLLMLVIVIGIVGLAYSYISGVFSGRTAVLLSIDAAATSCTGDVINVFVRNDGTQNSGQVVVNLYNATGVLVNNCTIPSIAANNVSWCNITKGSGFGAGYYKIVASAKDSSTSGQVYCSS